MTLDINKITTQYNFSEEEKKIMNDSGTANTAAMNQSRIVSEFILGKKIETATDSIIKSNEKLTASNEKYLKGMLYLTGALVFVGIVNIFF